MSETVIAVILGFVEGATEFVPVSSTGHLIVVGSLLGFTGDRAATFEIFIQLGAILAVAWVYRRRLWALFTPDRMQSDGLRGVQGIGLIAISTIPALALGAALHGPIREYLFRPWTVAIGWFIGGIVILLVERFRPGARIQSVDQLTWRTAILIGIFQCASLWPGISRAAATMSGGLLLGLQRQVAAEYSFLIAIPIIAAASLFELVSGASRLSRADIPVFAIGFAVAFMSAWIAVSIFLRLLARVTLRPFAWYRLVAAGIVIVVLLVNPEMVSV